MKTSQENSQWIEPYWVQRLKPPSNNSNLNLSGDRVDMSFLFSLDYMGSSEFEEGKVSKALKKMNDLRLNNLLDTFVTEAKVVDIHYENPEIVTFYGICHKDKKNKVIDFIYKAGNDNPNVHLAEGLGIWQTLEKDRILPKTVGWVELENPFMFFTDLEMYIKICDILRVPAKLESGICV